VLWQHVFQIVVCVLSAVQHAVAHYTYFIQVKLSVYYINLDISFCADMECIKYYSTFLKRAVL